MSLAKFSAVGSGEPDARCNTEAHAPEPTSPPRRSLWLARHIYWCKLDSKIIVLDLARDKYLGLGKAVVQTLAATVQGWPEPDTHEPPQQVRIPADEASRIIR